MKKQKKLLKHFKEAIKSQEKTCSNCKWEHAPMNAVCLSCSRAIRPDRYEPQVQKENAPFISGFEIES